MTCRIDVNFIHADERKGKKEKKQQHVLGFT